MGAASPEKLSSGLLQPKIVIDGGPNAKVIRVTDDTDDTGLPRRIGPPPPLPMTSSQPQHAVSHVIRRCFSSDGCVVLALAFGVDVTFPNSVTGFLR
jgi:hypothetical protein